VTLDNRKWYMGYVLDSPNLDPQEQYFAVIPVLSGYRDPDTLVISETVLYESAYEEGLDKNAFAVTLPIANVRMASFFQKDAYERFFAARSRRRRPKPRG
jgi:hypothetical protein